VFGKKTSITFDIRSLADLFESKEDTDDLEMIAHSIFTALYAIKEKKESTLKIAETFKRFWQLAITSLPLSKINEMI
jgi:hypothetical protein